MRLSGTDISAETQMSRLVEGFIMGRFEMVIGAQFGGCLIKLAVTVLSVKRPPLVFGAQTAFTTDLSRRTIPLPEAATDDEVSPGWPSGDHFTHSKFQNSRRAFTLSLGVL